MSFKLDPAVTNSEEVEHSKFTAISNHISNDLIGLTRPVNEENLKNPKIEEAFLHVKPC